MCASYTVKWWFFTQMRCKYFNATIIIEYSTFIQISVILRFIVSRFRWLHGLRRRSAAACLLRLRVRIPPGGWMCVSCECCVLSSRGLCDELITRPEESYRTWCVVLCDLETPWIRRTWHAMGRSAKSRNKYFTLYILPPLNQLCGDFQSCNILKLA